MTKKCSPFLDFNTSPEIIRLAVPAGYDEDGQPDGITLIAAFLARTT